jgi:hypothetical protein
MEYYTKVLLKNNSVATKARRHEVMICILNYYKSTNCLPFDLYGYGMNKSHCNLGALVSWWLNEYNQSFFFDQTGRFSGQ